MLKRKVSPLIKYKGYILKYLAERTAKDVYHSGLNNRQLSVPSSKVQFTRRLVGFVKIKTALVGQNARKTQLTLKKTEIEKDLLNRSYAIFTCGESLMGVRQFGLNRNSSNYC